MTIRLLSTYDGFSPNDIITLSPTLETAMVNAGNATTNLTGGVVAYRERKPVMVQPAVKQRGSVSLIANRKAILPLSEGSVLTITPTAGTTGTYQRYDASGAAVGALTAVGTLPLVVGPTEGDSMVEIKCTTGALVAKVGDAGASAAQQVPALATRVMRSNIMEDQIYGTVQAQAQTTANFTHHMTIVIPTDATEFQVVLDNVSTTLPFRIKSAIIATSDTVGPDLVYGTTTGQLRVTPRNGTAWKPLTWDGGSASVEIAVAPSTSRKTRKASDYILCPTVPNADGSKLRVVMIRFYVEGTTASPGNGRCSGAYSTVWRTTLANTPLHKGFIWQSIRYAADGVTTPANFQPTEDLSALPFLTCIRYKTRKPGITVNVIGGDSIPGGAVNGFIGNFGNNWVFQLVNLLRDKYPNIPFSLSNNGFPATGTAIYAQNALDYIAAGAVIGLPIYQPASQNDGVPSKAQYDAAMGRMATVCGVLQEKGKTVALMTPIVNTALAWTAPEDAIRLAQRQEILDMQTAGLTVALDMESVSDGAVPARYQTAYSTDLSHPNEAGSAVIAADNLVRISSLIGL